MAVQVHCDLDGTVAELIPHVGQTGTGLDWQGSVTASGPGGITIVSNAPLGPPKKRAPPGSE